MKPLNEAGFTIIETMLFFGITSLLVTGVLIGIGTSINIQRYRDSVSSLQSVLQQQFSEVSNVDNNRDDNWACDSSSLVTGQSPGSGIARGQSDCVILGRFITTNDSRVLSIKSVVGYIPSSSIIALNDIDALKQYNVQVSPVTSEIYEIEWGSSLVRPGTNTAMVFSMLILRSPSSGIIRTFIDSSSSTAVEDHDIKTLITQSALMQSTTTCVNSNGLFTNGKSAILVKANATSASGIETLGDATSGC